jgi:hypothetical protein
MTNEELVAYYAGLLIIQYIGQNNAYATVSATAALLILNQLPLQIQNAFNMDGSAVGVQLDVIGKYAGVTRYGTGFNGQPITLDDTDFFTLIQLAVAQNSAGSSLSQIQTLLNTYFSGDIFVFDHKDMRMSYIINSNLGNQNLIALFITEGLLPRPMGVQLAAPIYTSITAFFGMLNSVDVATYATQNSVSITAAANTIASDDRILGYNNATAPTDTPWLNSILGVTA